MKKIKSSEILPSKITSINRGSWLFLHALLCAYICTSIIHTMRASTLFTVVCVHAHEQVCLHVWAYGVTVCMCIFPLHALGILLAMWFVCSFLQGPMFTYQYMPVSTLKQQLQF